MAHDTAKATTKLRGLTAQFDNAIKAYTPFWTRMATPVQSKGADERYSILGRVPGVREWIGERDFQELRAADWTLVNQKWEESIEIDYDDIEDDRLGMYAPVMAQIGLRMAQHPDELIFSLINNGEATACFDTQFFFDTDHSWGDSGTQSNDLEYNATDHTSVTAAEMKAAFNAARQALLGFQDDQGKLLNGPIYQDMSGLLLLVPPALEQVAYDGLTSVLLGGGDTNVVINRPEIVVSPSFSSSVKFDLYKLDAPLKPYIFQQRRPVRRAIEGYGKTTIKDKGVYFMADARYTAGYGAWWTAVRTTFN